MTQARQQDHQTATKRPSRSKLAAARNAATGHFVIVQAGPLTAEVTVSKERFDRIVQKKRVVGKVISGYADAAAKAARSGRDFFIGYRVSPDGQVFEVTEVTAKPAASPLDAAVARAKARGTTKVTDILKGEDMLTARDFGPLIGASHETVNTKRKRHEVLGLEGATRGVKYPRWQVTDSGLPLPGLSRLFEILGAQPWTIYRFLRTQHAELGDKTALDLLKAGQVDVVMDVAKSQAAGAFA